MELLKQLYKVHSPSKNEGAMRKFITKWIKNNCVGVDVWEDIAGNLFAAKGYAETYPCVVAHMDEVHTIRPKRFKVVTYLDNYLLGGDAELLRPCGIGADDKNGIWVALRLLEKYDVMKAAFFVGEEIGCVGSNKCEMDFFDDCRWVLQADRKGGEDFITSAGGVELCNDKFKSALQIENFGYKCATGLSTDVMTLKERGLAVACANVSCGYYNPHTADEYTSFVELENCLDLFCYAVENVTEVQKHKHIRKFDIPVSGNGVYRFPSYMNHYADDDDIPTPDYSRAWNF